MAVWVDFDLQRKEVVLIDTKNYQSYAWYCDSRIYIVCVNAFGMIANRMRIHFQSDADRADFVSSMPECFRSRLMLDPNAPKLLLSRRVGCERTRGALENFDAAPLPPIVHDSQPVAAAMTTCVIVPTQKRIAKKAISRRQSDNDAEWQASGDESASEDEDELELDEHDSLDEDVGSYDGWEQGGAQQNVESSCRDESGARQKKRRRIMSRKQKTLDILEMAMGEIADELDVAGTDSTVSGPEELNVNGMLTMPVTHLDPGRHASYSGMKPLVPLSAPEPSRANLISRALKKRNEKKGAQKAVVDEQVVPTYTTSDSAKSQSKKRKLFVQLAPTEPIAKSRSRRRSAAAASDWFKTLGGHFPPEPPKTLPSSVKQAKALPISKTTSAKPNESSFTQPTMYRVRNKEAATAIQCSPNLDQVIQTPVIHDSNDTQAYQADEEAVAAAESLCFVTHLWNADHDAALHSHNAI
ncbi:hypothetical protein AAVH_08970 [Aphelenchoides avenae]|nr:hypothetical protein AAVH_08970 [Aphelenchus avenae]